MDKIKEILLKLLQRIDEVEEIAVHNNNLLGFILSKRQSSAKFSPETKKLVSIHMDSEMMAYIEENDIDLDLFGDA